MPWWPEILAPAPITKDSLFYSHFTYICQVSPQKENTTCWRLLQCLLKPLLHLTQAGELSKVSECLGFDSWILHLLLQLFQNQGITVCTL